MRDLVGARYAALGVPDEDGTGFDRFITAGMTDEQIEAIGPLPRTHGLLAAMLTDPEPYRTDDIRADPRFEWWPEAHPRMLALLGRGLTNAAIARELFVAEKTVKTHVSSILAKLRLADRTQAALYAARLGLST